jgi:hypothetical protein
LKWLAAGPATCCGALGNCEGCEGECLGMKISNPIGDIAKVLRLLPTEKLSGEQTFFLVLVLLGLVLCLAALLRNISWQHATLFVLFFGFLVFVAARIR